MPNMFAILSARLNFWFPPLKTPGAYSFICNDTVPLSRASLDQYTSALSRGTRGSRALALNSSLVSSAETITYDFPAILLQPAPLDVQSA